MAGVGVGGGVVGRSGGGGGAGVAAGRAGERVVVGDGRGVRVFGELPVLLEVAGGEGAGARRPAGHAVRGARDGKDFVKTNKWIVFGHHFAAISGPGPLVGPVLAAQFGYLPGTLWILIGVVLGGAVQDLVILFASIRRDGKSLGQMVKEELNTAAGFMALVASWRS